MGNGAFMREQGVDSGALQVRARELEEAGRTVVYAARNGKVLGLISITYEAQDDLQDLIKTLRLDGVKQFYLVSGDNARVVAALAGPLHFDSYRGNLRPEEKALYVEGAGSPRGTSWRLSGTGSTTPRRCPKPAWGWPWARPAQRRPSSRRTSPWRTTN